MISQLTVERLKALMAYDPETGDFTYIAAPRSHSEVLGKVAGCLQVEGYHVCKIDGIAYRAHRLAWLFMTGEWPAGQIDHRNGIRNDNRWANLRPASLAENARNARVKKTSKSGVKGVWRDDRLKSNNWFASICVDRVKHPLGRFSSKEAAASAYRAAAVELHGQFARLD